MPVPYRDLSERIETKIPTELTYIPATRDDRETGISTAFQITALPIAVGVGFALAVGRAAGVAALLVPLGLSIWRGSTKPKPGAVLQVHDGELIVLARGTMLPTYRVSLEHLDDVILETKQVERVVEGSSSVPWMRTINPQIAPKTDTNRIALQAVGESPYALSDDFLSHIDSLEWFGKIRVFLRKNGWIPKDERAA